MIIYDPYYGDISDYEVMFDFVYVLCGVFETVLEKRATYWCSNHRVSNFNAFDSDALKRNTKF